MGRTKELFPMAVGDGRMIAESHLLLENNAQRSVVASIAETDLEAAAMWFQSLPADDERELAADAYIWSPQGSSSESIRWIIESMPLQTEGRRGRGTVLDHYDETALNLTAVDRSLSVESVLSSEFVSSAIPEPSAAILTAVGIFGLLRRLRHAANILSASANPCKRPFCRRTLPWPIVSHLQQH
ncbi:MAG: hypothetical protein Q8Q59_00155 [Luteolibacter sp.]|jgi:hypothetical protein|nr:hypothetical protein [Luteolibacter sp.]